MDNLTHSVIGLALAEAATRLRATRGNAQKAAAEKLRVPLWLVCAAASNVPDLDFMYARITAGRLGYLLHHRGHTHTMGLLPVLAAFVLLLAWAATRRGRAVKSSAKSSKAANRAWTRDDWLWLAGVSVAGVALHVGFDYLNSYGVHPFWPLSSRWHYGDTLFIVEPWLWVTLVPPLLFAATSLAGRIILGAIFALALGLALFTGYVPWPVTIVLTLWGFWQLGLMTKLSAGARIAVSWAACCLLIAFFATGSSAVKQRVRATLTERFPNSKVLDVSLSPYPANPLCWFLFTVETEGTHYVARKGTFALFPRAYGAAECPELRGGASLTFKLKPVAAAPSPELVWAGEFRAPASELRRLYRADCRVRALLQFARVPAWSPDGRLVGDLRFDRSENLDFTELELGTTPPRDADCPRNLPPWRAPRADVLESGDESV